MTQIWRPGYVVDVKEFRYIGRDGVSHSSAKPPIWKGTARIAIVRGWESGDHHVFYRGRGKDKAVTQFIAEHVDPKDPFLYFYAEQARD